MDGEWRTIRGVHVLIGKGGSILKGPKALQKKDIQKRLKKQFKEKSAKEQIEELEKKKENAKGFLEKAKIQNEITALEKGFKNYEEYKNSLNNKTLNVEKEYNIKSKEINNFIDEQKIDISKYNNDYNYEGYRKSNSNLQEKYAKKIGYDKPMIKVSKKDYDKIKSKEITRIINGNDKISSKEILKNSVDGEIKYSDKTRSYYGKGMYFGDKNDESKLIKEYGKGDFAKINCKISDSAKVAEFNDMSDYIKKVSTISKSIENEELKRFIYNNNENTNILFMNSGIDVIKIKKENYYVVLNRGVLTTYE